MKRNRKAGNSKYADMYRSNGKRSAAREWIQDNEEYLRRELLQKDTIIISPEKLPADVPVWRKIGNTLVIAEEIKAFHIDKEGLELKL